MSTYEGDFFAWTQAQADALRRHAPNEIDYENLAEEIESVGRSDRREIASRLEVLLVRLLKWAYQPEMRSGSWEGSISEARERIADLIDDSPSLRDHPAHVLGKAYKYATGDKDIRRLELYSLPPECPWTAEQALDRDFLPP
jgi:hypothetical protein